MSVHLTPHTRTEILLQGEDEERLSDLRATAAELRAKAEGLRRKAASTRADALLADSDEWAEAEAAAKAAEEAAEAFASEANERGVKVVMRHIGRKKWREIIAKHPPREGDAGDKVARYNVDTAPDDIVPACLASPALNDADREAFLDSLSDGQFDRLAWLAHEVNRSFGADPTPRLLSVSSQTSDATSSSPSAQE